MNLRKPLVWLLAALAVGFALRVFLLGAQSLWNDEGISVALAPLDLGTIAASAARDIHPPLYYFLLHFWIPLAGTSEYAVRFLSVIGGTLTVAVTYRIARAFFDWRVGLLAAWIAGISSFQVYYSQEARMYIWVTLWSGLSVLAMAMMLRRARGEGRGAESERRGAKSAGRGAKGEGREVQNGEGGARSATSNSRTRRSLFWLLYIVATIAAMYTMYFAAMVLVAENLAFLVWFYFAWRDRRPNARHSLYFWIAAQIIVALVSAPWYLYVRDQLASWPAISDAFDLQTLVWRLLVVFSAGLTLEGTLAAALAVLLGALFLVGLWRSRRTEANWGIATLILWALFPVAGMFLISLTRPDYNPKFLLLATPAFYILSARGLSRIIRPGLPATVRYLPLAACSIIILAGSAASLLDYYDDPQFARDDYRSILRYVDSNERAGDAILVDAPGQVDVVRYYQQGPQPIYLLPKMRPVKPRLTREDVDDMLSHAQRLFAIYYATDQSDQGVVETRLAQRAFKALDEWHGNVRLAVYGIAGSSRPTPQPVGAKLGDEITLTSFQLDQPEARPGDVLTLTLNWRADQSPSARYKVFVHLLDANNQVIAQRDGEPVGDTRITTTWHAGDAIADNYGILIPEDAPSDWRIEIGMYRVDSGARLPILTSGGQPVGDHLILATVRAK